MVIRSQTLKDLPAGIDVYSCTFKIGWSKLTSRELAVLEEVIVIRYSMYMSIIIEGMFREQRARCKSSKGVEAQVPENEAPDPKQETFAEGSNPRHTRPSSHFVCLKHLADF
jgi:hypothetical protein